MTATYSQVGANRHASASVADNRYLNIRQVLWRNGEVPRDSRYMLSTGIDADLMEYLFWARNVRGLADNTVRVRFDLLQRLYVYANRPLRDLTASDVLAFERVAIAGRQPESRRAYVCHIRAFYRWATQTGMLEVDPSTMLTLPVVPKHLPRPISEEDLARALADARPKMRAMLTLAAYAGLRCIEIAGLDWSDLHRETDSIFIHVRHGKGAKERRVEAGQVVVSALQAYGMRTRGIMFIGLEARPMDSRGISSAGNRFLQQHGIDATMHQLRHRYGTIGYQLTRDLRLIQEQMGHSSPMTTAGYTRPSAEAAGRLVAAMDALGLPEPRGEAPEKVH